MKKFLEKMSWLYKTHIGRIALAVVLILVSATLLNFYSWPVYPLIAGGAVIVGYFFVMIYYAVKSIFKKKE